MNPIIRNPYQIILSVILILNGFIQNYGQTYTYNIKLSPHIVRDDYGNYGLSNQAATLQTLIDNINEKYTTQNSADIHFELTLPDFIDNSYYTSGDEIEFRPNGNIFEDPKLLSLFDERDTQGVIHIYFIARQFTTEAADGVSEDIPGNKIVLTNEAALYTTTLAHEVAHCLGLLHTYQGEKLDIWPTNNISWSDEEGPYEPEWVNRSGSCVNWSTNGDLLKGTFADPIAGEGDIAKFLNGCVVHNNNNITDNSSCQTPYETNILIHNIMALNTGCDRYQFTDDQIQRMHDFLDDRLLYLKNTVQTTIANKFDDDIIPDDQYQTSTLKIDGADFSSNSILYLNDGVQTSKTNQERFEGYLSTDIKHHDWNLNTEEIEYHITESFNIDYPGSYERTAYFDEMNSIGTINIKAENTIILEAPEGDVEFKDPWYLFAGDIQEEDQDEAWISNDNPNWLTGAYNQSTGGIFLGEQPSQSDPSIPYYSVRVPQVQPDPITINNQQHLLYFYKWVGNSAVSIVHPDYNETPIVFNGENATVTALLKGHLLSNSSNGLNGTQRRLVRTDNGYYHLVYESMGVAWYTQSLSTDFGGSSGDEYLVGGRNPSITYYGNDIYIVSECPGNEQYSTIQMLEVSTTGTVYDPDSGTPTEITSFPTAYYGNAKPVVGVKNGFYFVAYRKNASEGIYCWYKPGGSSWYESEIDSTDSYSINPSAVSYHYTGSGVYFVHLAYEQGNAVKYQKFKHGNTTMIPASPKTKLSYGDGYTYNVAPSISIAGNGYPVVSWIGYNGTALPKVNKENGQQNESKVVVRRGNSNGLTWGAFEKAGSDVLSVNNNSETSSYEKTVIVWSEGNGSGYDGKWIRRESSLYIDAQNLSNDGSQNQVSNGSSLSDMGSTALIVSTSPYDVNMSTTDFSDDVTGGGGIGKISNATDLTYGREGIASIGGVEFVFDIGDVFVGDSVIRFISRPDTLPVSSEQELNQVVRTVDFALDENTEFYFTNFYYVINRQYADSSLTAEDAVNFKAELIKSSTNEVIGTYDNITYNLNNLEKYDNVDYQVNCSGITAGDYYLRLVTTVAGEADYTLADIQNTSFDIEKKSYSEVLFSGETIPEEYALSQNYPNPFNPATTIKFQLPQSSNVTLKIYDILGREVTTLVDEFKTEGRYEVHFNASSLASGVYLYRIKANDPSASSGHSFVNVKKMILLK